MILFDNPISIAFMLINTFFLMLWYIIANAAFKEKYYLTESVAILLIGLTTSQMIVSSTNIYLILIQVAMCSVFQELIKLDEKIKQNEENHEL